MKYVCLAIVLLACVVSAESCKKKSSPQPKPVYSYSFTDSGSMYTFNPISFRSAAPKGCTYTWKFGDGTTSNDSFPVHIYYNPDSFQVTLIVNNDSEHATHGTVYIASTAQKMNGGYWTAHEGGTSQTSKWPINFAGIGYGGGVASLSFGIKVNNEGSVDIRDSVSHTYHAVNTLSRNDALITDHSVTYQDPLGVKYLTYDFVAEHIYFGLVDTSSPGIFFIDAFKLK